VTHIHALNSSNKIF